MGVKGLESLEVWQIARGLAVRVCRDILPMLPPEEKWGLTTQMRKSAQSVSANIAEGFGRYLLSGRREVLLHCSRFP